MKEIEGELPPEAKENSRTLHRRFEDFLEGNEDRQDELASHQIKYQTEEFKRSQKTTEIPGRDTELLSHYSQQTKQKMAPKKSKKSLTILPTVNGSTPYIRGNDWPTNDDLLRLEESFIAQISKELDSTQLDPSGRSNHLTKISQGESSEVRENQMLSKKEILQICKANEEKEKDAAGGLDAWTNAAIKLFGKLNFLDNSERSIQICEMLIHWFPHSIWFVFVMDRNDKWVWKKNNGVFQMWKASPGLASSVPKSGSPKHDFAVWAIMNPVDSKDSETIEEYHFKKTVEDIMSDAQDCKKESTALDLIYRRFNDEGVPWSFIFVSPNEKTAQSRDCVNHMYFENLTNFAIYIYLGS